MYTLKHDLLDIQHGIIVHGCNCRGIMGAGVARAVRLAYPTVFQAYRTTYLTRGLCLGTAQVCYSPRDATQAWVATHGDASCHDLPSGLVIVNAMTQVDYGTQRRQADYDAITAVFARVRLVARDAGLPVYFPLIGCGLAGGDWNEVRSRIEQSLGHDIEATLVTL